MEHLSMCRICLATDVQLCSIEKNLQHMYEMITAMTFKREDKRPQVACYICHARLQNCYRLRKSCLRGEELLTRILSGSELVAEEMTSMNTFVQVSVVNISLGQNNTESHIKIESPEVIHDTELDQQYSIDIKMEPQEEYYAQIDDGGQCSSSYLEDPLEVTGNESDDVEIDEDLKLKIEDITVEENKPIDAGPSSQSADNVCPKNLKVVSERIVLNSAIPATGVLALKKLAETDSHLVMEPQNKNIFSDNLIAVSNLDETVHKVGATLHKGSKIMADYEVYKQASKSSICSIKKCFRSEAHLNCPSRTHTREKRFLCNVCNKYLSSKRNLSDHMHKHTGEKCQCYVCNKYFSNSRNLLLHMNTHNDEKRFECDVCNKCFNNRSNLIHHMDRHTNKKRFQCDVCNKYLSSKRNLSDHMHTHTGEKCQCYMCNKYFSSLGTLRRHLYQHSDRSEKKLFQCDICKKCFSHRRNLVQHMNTHTDEKRFQCNVCSKYLSSKQNLKLHMYKHTGKKRNSS